VWRWRTLPFANFSLRSLKTALMRTVMNLRNGSRPKRLSAPSCHGSVRNLLRQLYGFALANQGYDPRDASAATILSIPFTTPALLTSRAFWAAVFPKP
jgi:hypothetical protein